MTINHYNQYVPEKNTESTLTFAKGQSPNKYGYGREYFVYHTDQIDPDRPGNMGLSVAPVAGEDERIEVREGESVRGGKKKKRNSTW